MEEDLLNDNVIAIDESLAVYREVNRIIKLTSKNMKVNDSFLVPNDLLYTKDRRDYEDPRKMVPRVKHHLPKDSKTIVFKAILVNTGVRVFKIYKKDDPLYNKPSS
jgi:hypothetical protein